MKAIQKLRAAMEAIGGTVDDTDYSIHLDAPSGYVWLSTGLPTFTIHYATNRQSWLMQAIREELPELRRGLSKVFDPEDIKEIRYNLDDDSWGASEDAPEYISFDFKL